VAVAANSCSISEAVICSAIVISFSLFSSLQLPIHAFLLTNYGRRLNINDWKKPFAPGLGLGVASINSVYRFFLAGSCLKVGEGIDNLSFQDERSVVLSAWTGACSTGSDG
jgi:hypothetical protein